MPTHTPIPDTEPSSPAAPGRRDKRKIESRQRLLAAARQLFVERGYHDTRPQDITRLSGVGHGTFYLYFTDKRACFEAFAAQAQQEIDLLIQVRLEKCDTAAERVYGVMETSMDYARSNPGVLKAALTGQQLISREHPEADGSASIIDVWASRWAEIIRREQASGRIWADYDPAIIGYAVMMVITVVTGDSQVAGADKQHFLTNLTRFVLRALAAPEKIM